MECIPDSMHTSQNAVGCATTDLARTDLRTIELSSTEMALI